MAVRRLVQLGRRVYFPITAVLTLLSSCRPSLLPLFLTESNEAA